MINTSKWPARIALMTSAGMLAVILGLFDAYGQASTGFLTVQATPSESAAASSSAPSPTVSCIANLPAPIPSPSPICRTVSPSPSPTPTAEPTASPSVSPTTGPPQKKASTIYIAYKGSTDKFFGIVISSKKCESKRDVVVRRIRDGSDPIVAKDTTDKQGRWEAKEEKARGRFYAQVLERAFGKYGALTVCSAARSTPIRVG